MKSFGLFIAKHKWIVLAVATVLLIPSALGMAATHVNYDLLTYLPQDLDSTRGGQILDKEFSNAATAMLILEHMPEKEALALKKKLEPIEGVENITWVDDIADITVPKYMLPEDIQSMFYHGDSTLMMIKFSDSASSVETQSAISKIRDTAGKEAFLAGMSAIIKDTKDIADRESSIYVLIAVVLSAIVLALTNASFLIPLLFLIGIGYAIVFNLGTNYFLGEISYVTKIIAAVLQLGVTMDYSIFLMHRYDEERSLPGMTKAEAMADAIANTFASIAGSSTTTIAGFLALCVMQLTLGRDIGIVMVKGVVLGVVSTITVLPALILIMDGPIHRFRHRTLLPSFQRTSRFVTDHYKAITAIFVLLFIPAVYGAQNTEVYYNLDKTLPEDLPSIVATNKLKNDYGMTSTHFIILDRAVESHKINRMVADLKKIDGVEHILAPDALLGPSIPDFMWPETLSKQFESKGHKLIIVNSAYKAASDDIAHQLESMRRVIKSYDSKAMISGEGALTKDLTEIADKDFKRVSLFSILAVFGIILVVFTSLSIPVILVLSIELAIFINMGIPYYTGTVIPFVSSIVVGTIQLGSTIDYAILMTTRFREEIRKGFNKHDAMQVAVASASKPIVTSALSFFAATAGVGLISDMEIISSLCGLMARGAIISMLVIILVLPSILLISEGVINKTSRNFETSVVERIRAKKVNA